MNRAARVLGFAVSGIFLATNTALFIYAVFGAEKILPAIIALAGAFFGTASFHLLAKKMGAVLVAAPAVLSGVALFGVTLLLGFTTTGQSCGYATFLVAGFVSTIIISENGIGGLRDHYLWVEFLLPLVFVIIGLVAIFGGAGL